MRLKTDNDIKNGIYKPNRVYEDVFIPVKPNAYNAEYNGDKFVPPGFLKATDKLMVDILNMIKIYSASATTSLTSGIILFIIPSIPAFNVIIEEGQPEQEPCSIRLTTPSS